MKKLLSFGMILLALIIMLAACGEEDEGAEVASNTAEAEENTADSNGAEATEDEIDRSDWPETVKFAAAGIEGMEELTRRFDEFSALLEDLMGVEFEMFSLSDRTVSSTALEYGQVDMVLSGPSEYILSKIANPDIALVGGLERENYYTVFITHADSGIETLDDMVGKTVAMKDSGSTSGHIGPSGILVDEGYDLDQDFDIQLLGDASLEALRAGEVDAMGDGVKHYHTLVELDGEDEWNMLYEGPPLPPDPFILGPTLPDSFKEEFERVLFEHDEEILDAILASEDNDKYEDGKIIDVQDEDYNLMRETYETLGLELVE
jgi:phosphonate transport system substrate-binding protein